MACIVCVAGCAPAARGQEAEAEVLTLEQAVALALSENRQVKSASIEFEKYSDRLAALRTRRLPEFKFHTLASQLLTPMSFTFEKGVFGSFPDIGPIPDKTTEISTPRRPTFYVTGQINQPLSQLYRVNLGLKQLGVGREIAEQQLRLQRQAVINNVRRGYYAILQTQSSLRASEEARERGEPLRKALLDAGIMRLRPVMITVGATVFALFPLASHGGPLWEPMCYAQIGGLSVATFVTLLLVPVIYVIFVVDLKLVKWETVGEAAEHPTPSRFEQSGSEVTAPASPGITS